MDKTGKNLRLVAIIFMGLTAAMNILGGVGTTCAAFSNSVAYRLAFKDLLDYRWLYQGLVITTTLIGIAGVWATIKLVRGGPSVYRIALIVLVIGTILGGVQFFASMTLRGKATPANVKFFTNLLALIIFLVIKLPGIREKVDFTQPGGKINRAATTGLSSIVAGIATLTIFTWAGPSHTYFGENWVNVLQTPLIIGGTFLTLAGLGLVAWAIQEALRQEIAEAAPIPQVQNISS